MSRQKDNSDQRVEGLLRQWGSDEAARQTEPPPPPQIVIQAPDGREPRRSASPLRWVPALAAAVLLIAAGMLFVLTRMGPRTSEIEDRLDAASTKIASLDSALAENRAALDKAQADQEAAEDALTAERLAGQALSGRMSELENSLKSRNVTIAADKAQRDQLQMSLAEALATLEIAQTAAQQERSAHASTRENRQEVAKKLTRTEEKVTALVDELNRLRKMNDEAEAAGQKARAELAALQTRHAVMMLNVKRAYLAEGQAGEIGVSARQAAGRRGRLLERSASLRSLSLDDQTLRLLDRVDVLLTRLDLLNPYDSNASETLTEMFSGSGLEGEIDTAIKRGLVPPDVRTWLFEATLILAGADRVG